MKLTPRQIQRLQKLRKTAQGNVLSLDQFRLAMSAKFSIETLRNALRGGNIHPTTYHFLADVLAKHDPEPPPVTDGKTLAAGKDNGGEAAEPAEEDTSEDTTTHWGSR